MRDLSHQIYSFGDFTLDLTRGVLLRSGQEVRLRPKSFDLLRFLVENHGRLVGKEELFQAVWTDTFVTDDALLKRLQDLRAALGAEGREYIKTVPRRGYIFAADVTAGAPAPFEVAPEKGIRIRVVGIAAVAVLLGLSALLVYRAQLGRLASDPAPIRSIAVLPLKNLTNEPSNDYLSEGVTESLITALSRVRDLKVISRDSVIRLMGEERDPEQVGSRLGVAAVLEGSVRKGDESVRVAVRLVSVDDGRVLWARDTHERAIGDIFALQDEIAREVVQELRVHLDRQQALDLARTYTDNVAAYQAYLKGRYFWNKRTEAGLYKSIDYFTEAVHADPDYALAYVGLANAYLVLKSFTLITTQEARARVDAALTKALAIDETLGEAHTALAWMRFTYDWKWEEAEREFRRAIELQPNDATTHQWFAEFLTAMGRVEESIAEIRRAQELDPPSPIINTIAAHVYFYARRYDAAIEQCQRALELEPDFFVAHEYLGWAYMRKGMHEAARAALIRAQEIEDTPLQRLDISHAEAESGNIEGARRALHDVMASLERSRGPRHAYRMARIHSTLRERDAAFERLEDAFDEREEALVWLKVDPHLDDLRSDPRFADLLVRVGFDGAGSTLDTGGSSSIRQALHNSFGRTDHGELFSKPTADGGTGSSAFAGAEPAAQRPRARRSEFFIARSPSPSRLLPA